MPFSRLLRGIAVLHRTTRRHHTNQCFRCPFYRPLESDFAAQSASREHVVRGANGVRPVPDRRARIFHGRLLPRPQPLAEVHVKRHSCSRTCSLGTRRIDEGGVSIALICPVRAKTKRGMLISSGPCKLTHSCMNWYKLLINLSLRLQKRVHINILSKFFRKRLDTECISHIIPT